MPKIAFMFPGQGSQYVGMGKEFYDKIEVSRNIFEEAFEALGSDFKKILFDGPKEKLDKTEYTQPAILTVSIAIAKAFEEEGIIPSAVCGLSLGEYSAFTLSGVFKFKDAAELVKKRGRFMQEAVPFGKGSMAAVIGLDSGKVNDACSKASKYGKVYPANYNCPGQIVISGEIKALENACKIAEDMGARRTIMLSVSGPFHSPMMEPASKKLKVELDKIKMGKMKTPVITNVTGNFIKDGESVESILIKQIMNPVKWEHTINTLIKNDFDVFVEVGPGRALSGFVKKIDRKLKVFNVQNIESFNNVISYVKGGR